MADKKSRNWNFIIYPESAPSDWKQIINDLKIQWCCILHDKDKNDKAENEIKKAHYHVILAFDSTKSYSQMKELSERLNAPIPQPCMSLKGAIEYLWHKNNPEKYQYNKNEIECYGGLDIDGICEMTCTERKYVLQDIIKHIRNNNICEFKDIVNFALDNNRYDWFDVCMNYSSMSINMYCRSNRHSSKKYREDLETGEIYEED